jgi:hypothetical protein
MDEIRHTESTYNATEILWISYKSAHGMLYFPYGRK